MQVDRLAIVKRQVINTATSTSLKFKDFLSETHLSHHSKVILYLQSSSFWQIQVFDQIWALPLPMAIAFVR